MKKMIMLSLVLMTATMSSFAQTAKDTTAPKKELSKEEKAALKAKQEAETMEAYKEAGLTDAQIASCKEAVAAANQKSNELKKKEGLTEDEKTAGKKLISDEKNAKLKEIMGEDAYKKYNAARKRQKEASKAQQ